MKSKNTLALLFGLEIVLVILTYAFSLFSESISAFSYVSKLIFVLLLILANFGVFMALIGQKRWNHISWFMYFGFVIINIYAILINNYGISALTSVAALGSALMLVLEMIMVLSYQAPRSMKYKTGHDIKQDMTIKYLQKENEALKQMEEQTNKKLSYTAGALKAQNRKLGEDMEKMKKSVSRKAGAKTKKLEEELDKMKKASKASTEKLKKELASVKKRAKRAPAMKADSHFVASKTGNTFHRPHCVAVNKIAKEQVVWYDTAKKAQKAKYKACKVCNPLSSNGKKRYFVANKDGNKVHRASCVVADKIPKKKRIVFRQENAALKKGYKPCKLCFPLSK
ncbi:hypothetical protein JW968_01150 [Candidatus Woesearchaeota archaeon]|nr:hypothetical protein [Candidatus Woesearchaeota archaeon]